MQSQQRKQEILRLNGRYVDIRKVESPPLRDLLKQIKKAGGKESLKAQVKAWRQDWKDLKVAR